MPMTGFICHDDYLNKTAKLTDEELGRLFRACMTYHSTGELKELTGRESIAFDFIKEDMDKADAAYKAKCETNKTNRLQALERMTTTEVKRQRTLTNVDERKEKKEEKERELAERFERFWAIYPRHTNKEAARKAFAKLNPDDELMATILDAVKKQKESAQWTKDGGQFIPHPATWLNGARWKDEMPTGKKVAAQDFGQRDYSDVPKQMMDDLEKELAAFKEHTG